MRVVLFASIFGLAACQPLSGQNPQQAGRISCEMLYQGFSNNVNLAIEARNEGDQGEALYRMMAADMNLETLMERDCCRFEETCPAAISF